MQHRLNAFFILTNTTKFPYNQKNTQPHRVNSHFKVLTTSGTSLKRDSRFFFGDIFTRNRSLFKKMYFY